MRQPVTQHLQSGSRETDTGVPLVFLVYFNLILIFCVYACMFRYFQTAEKDIRFPEAGESGSCMLPGTGGGN